MEAQEIFSFETFLDIKDKLDKILSQNPDLIKATGNLKSPTKSHEKSNSKSTLHTDVEKYLEHSWLG